MLSQKEFTDKRAKSQCFYCYKKYVPGHKCEWQVFTLEIRGSGIEECLEEGEEEESDMISYELSDPTPQTSPHISLTALSGIPTHNTMRIEMQDKKYMLDQRLTTPFQSKWLPKLLRYDYEIEYKKGADNASADALSRIERQWVLFNLLAGTSNEIMDDVVATWSSDSSLQAIIKGLQDKTLINIKCACYYQEAYYLFLLEGIEENGQGIGKECFVSSGGQIIKVFSLFTHNSSLYSFTSGSTLFGSCLQTP
ncbi:hypothetical protein Tco_0998638 [Tanacetum coccineum]